jgi:hypothetical protein
MGVYTRVVDLEVIITIRSDKADNLRHSQVGAESEPEAGSAYTLI